MTIAHEKTKEKHRVGLLEQLGEDQRGVQVHPRVTTREWLKRYRAQGLPGAKLFRRKQRIAQLEGERDFFFRMVQNSAKNLVQANNIIKDLINESNFAGHYTGEAEEAKLEMVEWVADDDVLEKGRKWLKQFAGQQPQSSSSSS